MKKNTGTHGDPQGKPDWEGSGGKADLGLFSKRRPKASIAATQVSEAPL